MPDRKKPADHVNELKGLVVGYARQEITDPLGNLKSYLAWGAAGSILIGLGFAFLLLGALRGLQTVTFFNDPAKLAGGTWSFLPYLITFLVGLVAILLLVLAMRRGMKKGSKR